MAAAYAQEGVFFVRQVEVGHLLVAADIERADDEGAARQLAHHAAVGFALLVFAGGAVALQIEKFGAHQAHAFGAGGQRGGHLFGAIDVGGHFHAYAVLRGGRLQGQPGDFAGVRLLRVAPLAGALQIGLIQPPIQARAVAVQHHSLAVGHIEQGAACGHHGGQAQRAGDDGGVRGRAALRGAQARHLAQIERGGV